MNTIPKITAIALDDEPPGLQLLETYCDKSDLIQLQKTFTSASEMLRYVNAFPVDVVFLDIQMPEILGTELCKKLPPEIMVVFTTAYSNYAVEGFELNVVDFLLKPFSIARFRQTEEKIKQHYQYLHQRGNTGTPILYLRADYSLVKVPVNEILYIEGLEDYIKIKLENSAPVIVRLTMKEIMSRLPESQFVRIHRSYIVRLDKCERLRNGKIIIDNTESEHRKGVPPGSKRGV
ncbi:MAG: LytTR family DNA-binding domain-containing protein [Chitinophagaceae bacterium]